MATVFDVTVRDGAVPTLVTFGIDLAVYERELAVPWVKVRTPDATAILDVDPADQAVISSAGIAVPSVGTVPALQPDAEPIDVVVGVTVMVGLETVPAGVYVAEAEALNARALKASQASFNVPIRVRAWLILLMI